MGHAFYALENYYQAERVREEQHALLGDAGFSIASWAAEAAEDLINRLGSAPRRTSMILEWYTEIANNVSQRSETIGGTLSAPPGSARMG